MNRSVLFLAALGLGCAGASTPSTTTTTAPTPIQQPKTFLRDGSAPGFDKRDFPGVGAMQAWMRESPYVWVGYYVQSPCFTGSAWTGNRAALEAQGWGLAVIYVGQQAPGATPNIGAAGSPDCGRKPLSREQGEADAEQAVAIASGDGFPSRATIFLDVERADPFPAALGEYARGWISGVLSRGYTAGVYAHKVNADSLSRIQRAAFASAGVSGTPPFWVVNSVGFALGRTPTESGYAFATIWQNPSDATETWGGVTFRIDQNVAATRNPSRP